MGGSKMYHKGKHSHSALGCWALVDGRASRILFFSLRLTLRENVPHIFMLDSF